jgi:hypothetical protein
MLGSGSVAGESDYRIARVIGNPRTGCASPMWLLRSRADAMTGDDVPRGSRRGARWAGAVADGHKGRSLMKFLYIALVIALTLFSGLADSRAFLLAAQTWRDDRPDLLVLGKSLLFFAFGILLYVLSLKFLRYLGVHSATIQTSLWFLATIVGLAIISGEFLRWQRLDQAIAIVVAAGLTWLVVRVEA